MRIAAAAVMFGKHRPCFRRGLVRMLRKPAFSLKGEINSRLSSNFIGNICAIGCAASTISTLFLVGKRGERYQRGDVTENLSRKSRRYQQKKENVMSINIENK